MPRAKKVVAQVNTGNNLPAVPPGLPYGQRQATQQALAAVPDKGPGVAVAPPAGGPTAGPPAGPQGAPDQAALMAALQNYQPPQGNLLADTQRPGEPVTAGLATGPGAGPNTPTPDTQDVLAWKPYLPALEFMASQPDATMSTRQFVRRLRSMMPVTAPPGTAPATGPM